MRISVAAQHSLRRIYITYIVYIYLRRLYNRKVWKRKQQLSRIYFFFRRGNTVNLYYKRNIEYYNIIHCHLLENGYVSCSMCVCVSVYNFTIPDPNARGESVGPMYPLSKYISRLPKRSNERSMYVSVPLLPL